ncbi:MAG: hypothetical protein ACK4VZ_15185 [Paracoccaceae bacterium]
MLAIDLIGLGADKHHLLAPRKGQDRVASAIAVGVGRHHITPSNRIATCVAQIRHVELAYRAHVDAGQIEILDPVAAAACGQNNGIGTVCGGDGVITADGKNGVIACA